MIKIEQSIVISRPIEKVFAFVTNIENFPKWFPAVLQSKKISPGPVKIGTREHEIFRTYLLLKKENTSVVTDYQQNKKITWMTTPQNFFISQWHSTYFFEATRNGTKVTYIIQWESTGINKLIKNILIILGTIFDVKIPLIKLKKILESQCNSLN